jgi:predicted Zn-dependent protease
MTLPRSLPSFLVVLALNAAALTLLLLSATTYRVDLTSALELWREVIADVDHFGLASTAPLVQNEIAVGDAALRYFDVVRNDPRQAYLDAVGARLAKYAVRKRIPYRFHIIAMPQPNAFALPGGHIIVTTGMLDFVQNEAQLAAILGHEIAHVDLRHCIERLQYQLLVQRLGGPALGRLARGAYDLAARGYSEIKEREADRTGVLLMAEAGYSPFEAIALFDRFDREHEARGGGQKRKRGPVSEVVGSVGEALGDYYVSHPAAVDRMRDMDAILDRNMANWRGKTFTIGRTNLRDLRPAAEDPRADETITFSDQSPAYLLARGRAETLAGSPSKAVDYLTRAIAAAPYAADAYFVRAEAFAKTAQPGRAPADIERGVTLLQPQLDALEAAARERTAADDPARALAALKAAHPLFAQILRGYDLWIETAPADKERVDALKAKAQLREASDLIDEGKLLLALDKPNESVDAYLKASRVGALRLDAVEGLISARERSGQPSSAISDLTDLIARFPAEAELLRLRAEVYRKTGEPKRADSEEARYLRFKYDGVPPLTDRAWIAFEDFRANKPAAKAFVWDTAGRYYNYWNFRSIYTLRANAAKWCDEQLKADEKREPHERTECRVYALDNRIVWNYGAADLAAAYHNADPFENEGVTDGGALDAPLVAFPYTTNDLGAGFERWLILGDNAMKGADYVAAIDDYSKYLSESPGSPDALSKRAYAYAMKGDFAAAVADFGAALRVDPNYAKAYALRALAYRSKGDLGAAIADLDSALALRPAWSRGYLERAMLRYEKGDLDGVIEDFETIMRLKPDALRVLIWLHIARAQAHPQAADDFREKVEAFKDKSWPYPVALLFLEQNTPANLLADAFYAPQKCDARLFIGEYHALRDERGDALASLRAYVQTCPWSRDEVEIAKREIARLEQKLP